DLCIVSHLHPDHFDAAAVELMNKDIDILCQPGDDHFIKSAGFINVDAINESTKRNGIEIIRTAGLHGGGMWSEQMGRVSGFILKSEDEPTVYWSGDTVWYEEVNRIIQQFNPRIIITHSGGASFVKGEPIIMDEVQTLEVCRSAPNSIVIAVHLESLDHLTVTRSRLREYANANGIGPDKLLIPKDGDVVEIENS
ncbi:MAG: MBL fold metallo-hydrolase, partial [Candidatus Dadabacteria bacterium]|nr:MBL fold metallo-hydrolase [Candidatus Dadabacteria bacterium]